MTLLLKISNITDGVTNCSSEVFVVKNDDELRDLIDSLEDPVEDGFIEKHCDILNDEKSIKDFVLRYWRGENLDRFNKILPYNPLAEIFPGAFDMYGLSEELLWECFKQPYLDKLENYLCFDVSDTYEADTFAESDALAAISNFAWERNDAVAWHY